MSDCEWQKSSFSSADPNTNCVEIAAGTTAECRHLREGEEPEVVLNTSRTALRGLLDWAKTQGAV